MLRSSQAVLATVLLIGVEYPWGYHGPRSAHGIGQTAADVKRLWGCTCTEASFNADSDQGIDTLLTPLPLAVLLCRCVQAAKKGA